MEMKPFNVRQSCPKCTWRNWRVILCNSMLRNKLTMMPPMPWGIYSPNRCEDTTEHLHIWCNMCGYSETQMTADCINGLEEAYEMPLPEDFNVNR